MKEYSTTDDLYQTLDTPHREPDSPLWSESPSRQASLLARRYEIKGLLGTGGAGSVFRARDLVLGEDVALKVPKRVHPQLTEAIEDLRNEVRLARRVTHRSIARVYDLVEHDGVYFLTMECIDGMSLAKRLRRGKSRQDILPLHEVITLASQIAEGLYAAHCADVVHCDLKPENIMLSRSGRTVIMDFGISRTRQSNRPEGQVSGTPAYMSPEQFNSVPIDGRSDLFSLGVMMFEMLSGKLPFDGDTPMMMALARQHHDAPLLSLLRPDLPTEMIQLVARCMARHPKDRFTTAEELRRALLSVPLTVDQQSFVPPQTLQSDPDATLIARKEHRLCTVAIWRLQNQGQEAQSYLSETLADSLSDAIGEVRDVRVLPRAAMERQKLSAVPLEAAKKLGAHAFLYGTYALQGQHLSVTLKLLAVDSGFQLWTQRWEIPFGQAIQLCQQAAHCIATALMTEVSARQSESILDPETLSLYLKARQLYTGNDPAFFHRSVELLEQALARQPDSPLLRVGYAKACARAWYWGHEEDRIKAISAAERAVEMAPHQGASYAALAATRHGTGDLPGAVRALRKGLLIAPQLADLHELLGRILCECGPLSEAVAHLEWAMLLDPLNIRPRIDLIRAFALTGAWKQVETLSNYEVHDPREMPILWLIRGRMALWRKDPAWARHLLSLPGDDSFFCVRARRLMQRVADPATSPPLSSEEIVLYYGTHKGANSRRRSTLNQGKAELYCFENMAEQALGALKECVADGLYDLVWLDGCPLLSVLRASPALDSLRAQVAEQAERIHAAMDATVLSSAWH